MSEILAEYWAMIILALLAISLNIYTPLAESGQARMGTFFYRNRVYIEFANWLLVVAVVVFLSSQYTWWLLLSFFPLGALGAAIAKTLGGLTQILYIIGMPVSIVLVVIQLFR